MGSLRCKDFFRTQELISLSPTPYPYFQARSIEAGASAFV